MLPFFWCCKWDEVSEIFGLPLWKFMDFSIHFFCEIASNFSQRVWPPAYSGPRLLCKNGGKIAWKWAFFSNLQLLFSYDDHNNGSSFLFQDPNGVVKYYTQHLKLHSTKSGSVVRVASIATDIGSPHLVLHDINNLILDV